MTKTQREKAEREKLKQMLESNPKLKEVIDGMIEKKNPELRDAVENAIEDQLEKVRMQGIYIGWNAFALTAVNKVSGMKDMEEVKNYFQSESEKVQQKLKVNIEGTP